ncbi:NAD-dependent deacetylase sirtuin-2 [Trematosphaeria pertusa]|uniref:NAD-dependent deacetylase sirtuin-2 n=1 Tax=Trematosphaeria pertusa TaxID=390896 RepID=A0A6A6I4I5_9PLEO|nr:NAD-dependent deacetylase sirtuin-2 [Trematosphaeria pertusa]KAF2244938.1 NAD-dependent deacetylase sirtuin-2 [Trematosphaeria pertusa]
MFLRPISERHYRNLGVTQFRERSDQISRRGTSSNDAPPTSGFRGSRSFPSFKIGRKHKPHRQQLNQSKPWRNSEKGRSKGKGRSRRDKMGQDESHMVDEDTPPETLESRTVEAVAKFIKDGRAQRIVVMTGAGISTSAGIPDFRSPDTGLYANLARLNLPYAEAVFDISYFRNNPLPFYTLAQELYPGNYRPTITHSFIHLLHKKGLLLKLFTQNIDCLEREAGVPDEMIVEAHGSFARQSCIECKSPYPDDLMQKAIREKTVPKCLRETCGGLVKPEIVFFGEQLPAEFFANRMLPAEADLCIVMGTSLTVQPFASLPLFCREATPRVLINMDPVGDLGSRADDVLMLEDCDSGVRRLAEACGWLEELESLWAETAPKGKPEKEEAAKEKPKKSRDELLEEEVDKLTKQVEESLSLGKAQHEWLANHVDNKFARIQEQEETQVSETKTEKQAPETKAEATKENPDGEGLQHVFPWLSKKASL